MPSEMANCTQSLQNNQASLLALHQTRLADASAAVTWEIPSSLINQSKENTGQLRPHGKGLHLDDGCEFSGVNRVFGPPLIQSSRGPVRENFS